MSFANRLRFYRVAHEWTQAELASRLNVKQTTISSWENERTDPTMGQVVELCRIFNCTMSDLTDTRARAVGEITLEDILIKIGSLTKDEIHTIQSALHRRLESLMEADKIMQEKQELERQMAKMQERLNELEAKKVQ